MVNQDNDAKPGTGSSPDQGATGNSPSPTDDKPAPTMLETLQKSFEKHTASSTAQEKENATEEKVEPKEETPKTPTEPEKKEEEKEVEEPAKEPEPEEEPPVDERLDKHPRFQELLRERDRYKTDAQFGTQVSEYMRTKNISMQTFNQALQVCELLANNPIRAHEVLKPVMEQLSIVVGDKLSPDLQESVDKGEMTFSVAQKFQRLRSEQQIGAHQANLSAQQREQQSYVDTMNGWVQDKMKVDPDFKPASNGDIGLYEKVEGQFARLMQQQNRKLTPAETVNIVEQAYKAVKDSEAKRLPKPPARKVMRSTGSASTATTDMYNAPDLATLMKMSWEKHSR